MTISEQYAGISEQFVVTSIVKFERLARIFLIVTKDKGASHIDIVQTIGLFFL